MKSLQTVIKQMAFVLLLVVLLCSCNALEEHNQKPELGSLQQGLRTSAAIGYCASIAYSAAKGYPLPGNVVYNAGTGLIYVHIDQNYPLLFNKNIGDIVIAFHWGTNAGVMSVLFANIDVIGGSLKLYGIHTVPVMEESDGSLMALFAKQDIIIGAGSDTILNMGNITDLVLNTEVNRLNAAKPTDTFVAAKQNVWFINIDQNNTNSYMHDDNMTITGGGQIAEVQGESGGVIYHALINANINYSVCSMNPTSGYALSQNFKAGGEPYIDLGSTLLSFRNTCDGNAHVDISTGKYTGYNGKVISLGLN